MSSNNAIGLDVVHAEKLSKGLNKLLADYQIFYMNARGFHWNIKGRNFFELHNKFEELYTNLLTKIDEVAERIQTLGHVPLHSYSDYAKEASVVEKTNITDGRAAAAEILESLKMLIGDQRTLLALAADANDEGTVALMSDYIREQEKEVWMYQSYLEE